MAPNRWHRPEEDLRQAWIPAGWAAHPRHRRRPLGLMLAATRRTFFVIVCELLRAGAEAIRVVLAVDLEAAGHQVETSAAEAMATTAWPTPTPS